MRYLYTLGYITTLLTIVLTCSETGNETETPSVKEYNTRTGKTIVLMVMNPVGKSLNNIHITTKDFDHNISETYEDMDPVTDVLIADLDSNGFDEIYIVTVSSGSGSHGKILGFASNFDKSLSMINFPEIDSDDSRFDGYMGHDVFTIENGKLVRTFPVYKESDPNQSPTGGIRKLKYGLYPGEAMWQLRIQ